MCEMMTKEERAEKQERIKKVFSERLKKLVDSSCYSAYKISKMIEGVENQQAFHQYMNGKSLPKVDVLQGICDYFGVTSDYLYGFSDEPTPGANGIAEATGLNEETIARIANIKLLFMGSTILDSIDKIVSMGEFKKAVTNIGMAKLEADKESATGRAKPTEEAKADIDNVRSSAEFMKEAHIAIATDALNNCIKAYINGKDGK